MNAAVRVTDANAAQLIALRLASPKRAEASAPVERQDNADALPLFAVAAQPNLF